MDEFFIMPFVDLISQKVDIDLYCIGASIKIDIPYLLRDGLLRYRPAFGPSQQLKEPKFFRGEFDSASTAIDRHLRCINSQVVYHDQIIRICLLLP